MITTANLILLLPATLPGGKTTHLQRFIIVRETKRLNLCRQTFPKSTAALLHGEITTMTVILIWRWMDGRTIRRMSPKYSATMGMEHSPILAWICREHGGDRLNGGMSITTGD